MTVKALNLPADLIADWARRQTLASAKLEGRELPDDYIRSVQAQMFLNMRKAKQYSTSRPVLTPNDDGSMALWT